MAQPITGGSGGHERSGVVTHRTVEVGKPDPIERGAVVFQVSLPASIAPELRDGVIASLTRAAIAISRKHVGNVPVNTRDIKQAPHQPRNYTQEERSVRDFNRSD